MCHPIYKTPLKNREGSFSSYFALASMYIRIAESAYFEIMLCRNYRLCSSEVCRAKESICIRPSIILHDTGVHLSVYPLNLTR